MLVIKVDNPHEFCGELRDDLCFIYGIDEETNVRHNIAPIDSDDEIGCAGIVCDYDSNINYQELYKVLDVITDLPK